MPNYNVYITRAGLIVKRDRSTHNPINNFINEALINVTESSKEKALILAKKIKQNKRFVPEHEINAFTDSVSKKDQINIVENQEVKIEAS
jgi:hypothetical protein